MRLSNDGFLAFNDIFGFMNYLVHFALNLDFSFSLAFLDA
jgi:hypothetical protein